MYGLIHHNPFFNNMITGRNYGKKFLSRARNLWTCITLDGDYRNINQNEILHRSPGSLNLKYKKRKKLKKILSNTKLQIILCMSNTITLHIYCKYSNLLHKVKTKI